jgi:gas vesicle protein
MNNGPTTSSSNGFMLGVITGGVIGAALAIALAPRLAAELRQRVTAAAGDVADAATRTYRDASVRVVDAMDEVTSRGQAVRDDVADAVGRGARGVEQFAMSAKSDAKRG